MGRTVAAGRNYRSTSISTSTSTSTRPAAKWRVGDMTRAVSMMLSSPALSYLGVLVVAHLGRAVDLHVFSPFFFLPTAQVCVLLLIVGAANFVSAGAILQVSPRSGHRVRVVAATVLAVTGRQRRGIVGCDASSDAVGEARPRPVASELLWRFASSLSSSSSWSSLSSGRCRCRRCRCRRCRRRRRRRRGRHHGRCCFLLLVLAQLRFFSRSSLYIYSAYGGSLSEKRKREKAIALVRVQAWLVGKTQKGTWRVHVVRHVYVLEWFSF